MRTRRGVRTGKAVAAEWSALLGTALRALASAGAQHLSACLDLLGSAVEDMVAGQILDEPEAWAQVPQEARRQHWNHVCRGKLAIGNVAGPLPSVSAGPIVRARSCP